MKNNLINSVLHIIGAPVAWFWRRHREFKENGNYLKLVANAILASCAVIVLGFSIVTALLWFVNLAWEHIEVTLAIGALIWLFYFLKEDRHGNLAAPTAQKSMALLESEADKGYSAMLSVIFQTLRSCAEDIGGNVPNFMGEIELPERHYFHKGNVCFYEFRLEKSDISSVCDDRKLREYRNFLQEKLRKKALSGAFPEVEITSHRDEYGNGYDGIEIDRIEDFGAYYIIYAVYYSTDYAVFHRTQAQKELQRVIPSKELTTSWPDSDETENY